MHERYEIISPPRFRDQYFELLSDYPMKRTVISDALRTFEKEYEFVDVDTRTPQYCRFDPNSPLPPGAEYYDCGEPDFPIRIYYQVLPSLQKVKLIRIEVACNGVQLKAQ